MSEHTFADKYEVQQEIVQGAMGIEYKALDRKLDRVVTLKVLHPHLTSDASFLRRFLREIRAMVRLQHDNIVTIYDVAQDKGTYFMVMEYFPGANLHSLMQPNTGLPLTQALAITHQIAKALSYTHAQGFIHRDIKPANVIVDRQGTAKLMDFGISAALDKAAFTSAGQIIGTPEYMSPEQARGMPLDGRSDLYSVGIVMYEMLTGKTPYPEPSSTAILRKLAYDREELTLQFPSQVPVLVQEIVRDLLWHNPNDRITDAGSLVNLLQELGYSLPRAPSSITPDKSDETTLWELSPPQNDIPTIGDLEGGLPTSDTLPHALPGPPTTTPSSKWWQFWKRQDPPPPSSPPPHNTHDLPDPDLPGEPEPVLLGAAAPSKVIQGQVFTARFVAYAQTAEEKVGKMLASLAPDSSVHLALKTCRWKSGTDVVVQLSGRSLDVQCPTQTFKWEGGYSLVDFDVNVANDAPLGTTTLKYDVSIHDVIVARVRLDIEISHLQDSRAVKTASIYPAQTAFASYASEDRPRVLDRIAAVKISAGLDVWVDCLSLNPGEQWKSRMHQEICQRDLFLLFWSHHAKDSPWVTWEWHTALQEKGEPALQLHPLETPQEAPPPEELKHLHFGDPTILARKALE